MKKLNIILFILIVFSVHTVFAQSISINHQFQGEAFSTIRHGNYKSGWITITPAPGQPYTYHYMDSLQNIVSIVDNNIHYRIDTSFIYGTDTIYQKGGDELFASGMSPSGHLWGLFLDWTCYGSNWVFPQPITNHGDCYFLYDFDNQQKHYLDLQDYSFINNDPNYTANNQIAFLNDTIYLTIDAFNYNTWVINGDDLFSRCIKWANGAVISEGIFNDGAKHSVKMMLDHNQKLTHYRGMYLGNTNVTMTEGVDTNNNPISYHQPLILPPALSFPNSFDFRDACVFNNTTYTVGYTQDDPIPQTYYHFIYLKSNTIDSVIVIPPNIQPPLHSVCVDHAGRIWVLVDSAVAMYNGTWTSFSLQGNSPEVIASAFGREYSFNEYATNKFLIAADRMGYGPGGDEEIGNGIIFFTYHDTGATGTNYNHVHGHVYYDTNNNQIFDSGETPMTNQIVENGSIYSNVYPNGQYNLFVPSGPQTIVSNTNLPYLVTMPSAHNFNFITPTDTGGIDFAVQHTSPTNDLKVDLISGTHRTSQMISCAIIYKNTGSSAVSGQITMQFDPLLTFMTSSITPTSNTAGNLTWDFVNLMPFETRLIYFDFSPGNNFNIGDTVYAQASITPLVGDVIPTDNTDSTMSIFIGAYDPNMKVVTQNGAEVNTILNDDPLEYVIHFQNVGNDTAFTVVITDTISNLLDLSSLEIIGSSHANYWGIYNRTLQFTFNGINLPDSGTNQLASNGFISYRIKPVANISMGNIINNTAAIYFDVNAPVITNNAPVTLIDVTGLNEDATSVIKVVPNPANQIIYIIGKNNQNQTATVYDAVGKVVLKSVLNSNLSIDISSLSKGIYFVEVTGQRVKFVKE